jgi:putative redox protein
MKILLTRTKGLQFIAQDETGHKIVVDTEKEKGGFDEGIIPLRLLLISLAGCMAMDIVAIVQKKGGKFTRFEMELEGVQSEKHPKRYTKIIYNFKCEGDFKREDLLRAFELSRDQYCSVLATLTNPVEFVFNL